MLSVGPEGVELRCAQVALPDVGLYLAAPKVGMGMVAMEAIGQPIAGAVKEEDDGRESGAFAQGGGVLLDQGARNFRTRLRAAVEANGGQGDQHVTTTAGDRVPRSRPRAG